MRRTLKRLVQHLLEEHTSPVRMGCAVALGFFLGCLPFYGLPLPLCIAFAWLLKLNKATVYLAANISNPLFAPVLIAGLLGKAMVVLMLGPPNWGEGGDPAIGAIVAGDLIFALGFAIFLIGSRRSA